MTKYPRTYHLPWSLGATSDDKTLKSVEHFHDQEVVVTEKLDGENTTIYSGGYIHARSLDSRHHESQNWVRSLAGLIANDIPQNMRICGENVYARHSISYDTLSTYFYVFAIFEDNISLSWDDVVQYSKLLGLETVPVLYRGQWDEKLTKACYTKKSHFGGVQEGYVVRLAESFTIQDFSISVAKFVRANHVTPGTLHWRELTVVPNKLEI